MASGQVTISTHNGSTVSRGHNRRDPAIVSHEPHIDPNGRHEVWEDVDLAEFYERTFGEAQRVFDARTRESRRIGPYLDKLVADQLRLEQENKEIAARNKEHRAKGEGLEKIKPVKKPVYEMIIGVYPQDDAELTEAEQIEILRTWYFGDGTAQNPGFKARNPHMAVVGAYLHADEPDAQPHLHVDYVPVGEYDRGMAVQNSLERALNQQGIKSGKMMCPDGKARLRTAQEQWEAVENGHLQDICEGYGLDVLRPKAGKKSRHVSTAEKKRQTAAQEAAEAVLRAAERDAARIRRDAQTALRAAQRAEERAKDKEADLEREREKVLDALGDARDALEVIQGMEAELKAQRAAEGPLRAFLTAHYKKSGPGVLAKYDQEQAKQDKQRAASKGGAVSRVQRAARLVGQPGGPDWQLGG